MFRRMDDDSSKALKFDEFYKGVTETGLIMSEDAAREMFAKFDMDGSGTINIDEFLIAIRVMMDTQGQFLSNF